MAEWLETVPHDLPYLLKGTVITLKLLAVGLTAGSIIGLLTALIRLYGPRWLVRIVMVYIEVFRGTPLLVQMFLIYYGLPDLGIVLSGMMASYITLSLNSGSYQSDYFRGAIQAVGHGQMMAARAIGMSRLKAVVHIILPQALRIVIPAWSTEPITLVKLSAVAFLLAVPDVMGQAKIITARTFLALPTYFTVTLIYLVIVSILTLALGLLERRVRIPGLDVEAVRR
jgi:polar amino acid transport system permease protein